MKQFFAVGVGGFFGAMTRYGLSRVIPQESGFPLTTLCINSIGCFCLAWLFTKYTKRTPLILAIGTGFLGAFTTFSTFTVDSLLLFEQGKWFLAGSYIASSVGGGLFFSVLGVFFARRPVQ
ncbi:membrane protein [Lysinibacillus contaminans]|uniref:Fluoride-specific ion channel FluC n=1 Tax=Lysinibacillus contaminans TaxID=1293441 RepID=A0ABR5K129_9BACI|nr:CrcB family protein [Lysinibacillus contaminans]KOS68554.1 membrane protein [Lysinibacillus contaminans]